MVWGLPLTYYRSKFRKIVYQTDSWTINTKPLFTKELKGLFSNLYPHNPNYRRLRNFYRFYLVVYAILFFAYINFHNKQKSTNSDTMKKIEIGSTVPSFSLTDQYGDTFHLEEVLGKKNLVIYFYPKDDSPGCTKEACSFRDQFEIFAEEDAIIIGISDQSVKSHFDFAQKHHLNYTLLSDTKKKVRKLFGVPTNFLGLIPGRVTYVINKEGKVVFMFNSQILAEKHVTEALLILQKLK
jgi:peroxiredoxin Q/BCP